MSQSMDKIDYFNRLQALQNSSDDESEFNEIRGYMKDLVRSNGSYQKLQKPTTKFRTPEKVSNIHIPYSGPTLNLFLRKEVAQSLQKTLERKDVSTCDIVTPVTKQHVAEPQIALSLVKETPRNLWQKNAQRGIAHQEKPFIHNINSDFTDSKDVAHIKFDNLLSSQKGPPIPPSIEVLHENSHTRDEISTSIKPEPSCVVTNEMLIPSSEAVNNQSNTIPRIGSIVMNNSSGINSMLRKRRRKSALIKLVPEKDRIFAGQTFFFIPSDDIAPLRRKRIAKARSYGALWAKEWSSSVTHVVVDKSLNYKQLKAYLNPILGSESIPSYVILVNDEYPNECANFRCILDPFQERYRVNGSEAEYQPERLKSQKLVSIDSQKLNQIKEKHFSNEATIPTPVDETLSQEIQKIEASNANSFSSSEVTFSSKTVFSKKASKNTSNMNIFENQPCTLQKRDPLNDMLVEVRNVGHLPIDDDENCYQSRKNVMKIKPIENSEQIFRESKHDVEKKNRESPNRVEFLCAEDARKLAFDTNPNAETIYLLEELSDYYDWMRDEWRSRGYRRAIRTLKKHPVKISTYDEAIMLPNVGHRLAQKIEEIVHSHRLRRLDNAKMSPNDELLQKFLRIYGVGLSQASKWLAAGYKTLEDLKTNAQLTGNQRLGIEHYSDFNSRIPRAEVTVMGEIVQNAIQSLDSRYELLIAGSYRRGAETCGDFDAIITRPNTRHTGEIVPFLNDLVQHLTQDGFLVATLVTPGANGSKWHGACVQPGGTIWRRIDFLAVPAIERGAALLYFTGSDIFNRSIRLLSRKKGMHLNQHGLYRDVMRRPGAVAVNKGILIESADERRIFEILGVPWRPPEQRCI